MFRFGVENRHYHLLSREHLGPPISGTFAVSCIFRRIHHEITADCVQIPKLGGVRGGLERLRSGP